MDIENDDENQEVEMTTDGQETDAGFGPTDAETIIDLVADGKASEAREAIYAALYSKVGERIDTLRPEVRSGMVPTENGDEPIDLEADVDDSQE